MIKVINIYRLMNCDDSKKKNKIVSKNVVKKIIKKQTMTIEED